MSAAAMRAIGAPLLLAGLFAPAAEAQIDPVARGLAVKAGARATPGRAAAAIQGNTFGDSLIAGRQDTTSSDTIASVLTELTGRTWTNFGIGGQYSTHIAARQGGVPITLTISAPVANQINTYQANAIGAINGVAPVGMATAQTPDYRFLSQPGASGIVFEGGTLCGIHGRVRRSGTGGPPSTAEAYIFIADPAFGTFNCPASSAFTPDPTPSSWSQPLVFDAGRNNYSQTAQVLSDVAAMVAPLTATGNPNYVYLGVIKADTTNEWAGQTASTQIDTLNASLSIQLGGSLAAGGHFFDWNAYLISLATGDIMDQQDVANGVPPVTTRATLLTTTLLSALGTTGCPSLNAAAQTGVLKVDSEYILALTVSGNGVSTCTRGQGVGGGAAAHSVGAAVVIKDALHISGAADRATATYLSTNYAKLLTPQDAATLAVTPAATRMILQGQTRLGATNGPPVIFNGGISLPSGDIRLGNQQSLYTDDGNGNDTPIAKFNAATLYFGGSYVTTTCIGTGGGNCPLKVQYTGEAITTRGLLDQSFAYAAPTTGTTVTIADTSDMAVLEPAGTLAALAVVLPTCSASYSGKTARVSTTQAVTALTVSATGGTVSGAPSSLSANQGVAFLCRGTNTSWYRVQ